MVSLSVMSPALHAAALALAALTGGSAGVGERRANILPLAEPIGWTEDRMLFSSLSLGLEEWVPAERSTSEETPDELPDVSTSHVTFDGCELGLSGSLQLESWSQDGWPAAPAAHVVKQGHTEKDGQWLEYDQIPRRADRPESYLAYRYPVVDAPVISGYDLDKPDDEQRRGKMNAVGHGGVDLLAPMEAPIEMIRLEHQVGDAEVLFVGPLYGQTVVTHHVVREGGVERDYLLLFGHLDGAAG